MIAPTRYPNDPNGPAMRASGRALRKTPAPMIMLRLISMAVAADIFLILIMIATYSISVYCFDELRVISEEKYSSHNKEHCSFYNIDATKFSFFLKY